MPQLYNITSDDIFLKYSLKLTTHYRRPTFSKTVVVSVGISALGRTDLHFVDPDVKINGKYYRDVLLTRDLLPDIRQHSDYFIFHKMELRRIVLRKQSSCWRRQHLTLLRQRAFIAAGGGFFEHQLWRYIYFVNFSAWLIISFCETSVINLKISVMWL